MDEFDFENVERFEYDVTSPSYVKHLHEAKEMFETTAGLNSDIAALAAVGMSLMALSQALIEAAIEQGTEDTVVISTAMIGGIHDTVMWINDKVELSKF